MAVRACAIFLQQLLYGHGGSSMGTYNNSVVPSKDSEVIKSSYQIPPRSDVARYEDPKGDYREGVHEYFSTVRASPSFSTFDDERKNSLRGSSGA